MRNRGGQQEPAGSGADGAADGKKDAFASETGDAHRSRRPRFVTAFCAYSLFVAVIILAATVAVKIERSVPGTPASFGSFSEERALANLAELIDIAEKRDGAPVEGRRLYGITGRLAMTESGLETAAWVKGKLEEINAEVLASGRTRQADIDVRSLNGTVLQDNDSSAMWYNGVTNVVARIPGKSDRALIISGHYDTVAYSPGASDNGAAVVTILEIVRDLLMSEQLPYTVIALLDDAEETGLLGAYAFSKFHPWFKHVRVHLNLDSAGGWRVPMLTQLGPGNPWLGEAYRGVKSPHASAMVGDIFHVLPSSTNFEAMSSNNVPGFDLDFYNGGYSYHTPLDTVSDYVNGTLTLHGSNIRAIINNLAEQPEFERSEGVGTEARPTFYDILSWGLVMYSFETSRVIAGALVAGGVLVFAAFVSAFSRHVERRHVNILLFKSMPTAYFGLLLTTLLSFVLTILAGFIAERVLPNAFYSAPAYAGAYFGAFAMLGFAIGAGIVGSLLDRIRLPPTNLFTNEIILAFAANGVHLTILVVLSAIEWGTAYVPTMWTGTFIVAMSISLFLLTHFDNASAGARHIVAIGVYLVWLLMPLLINADIVMRMILALIPQTGRMGHTAHEGAFMGVIVGFMALFIMMPLAPLVGRAQHKSKIAFAVAVVCAALVGGLTTLKPYSDTKPERVDILHVYDLNTHSSRITFGVPHASAIPTSQFSPPQNWVPCTVPVWKYSFRPDGFCLADDPPKPDIDLPTFVTSSRTIAGSGALEVTVTVTAPMSPVWMVKFDGGLVAWSIDEKITAPGLSGRVLLEPDQRAIVMRTREDVSTFTLTFDNSTDKVDFEFWVSYQVQTPQLRETIKALSSDRQVWAKSNMPGPVATLFRTSAERPAASA